MQLKALELMIAADSHGPRLAVRASGTFEVGQGSATVGEGVHWIPILSQSKGRDCQALYGDLLREREAAVAETAASHDDGKIGIRETPLPMPDPKSTTVSLRTPRSRSLEPPQAFQERENCWFATLQGIDPIFRTFAMMGNGVVAAGHSEGGGVEVLAGNLDRGNAVESVSKARATSS